MPEARPVNTWPDDLRDADTAARAAVSDLLFAARTLEAREEHVIKAEYWDPGAYAAVTACIPGDSDLPRLLNAIVKIRSGRGHPALELTRPGGSSLTVATDGSRCALVWVNTLQESFHSTGGCPGPTLAYDYHGSWSEAPAQWAVPIAEALGCARNFIQHGTPDTESVLFEPD